MVVKHNTWSFREFQGGEFRICYVNCGWSYSDVRFQVKKYSSTRKWLFFGPFISYWSEPISVGVINNLLPVTHRKLFYSEDKVDRDFLKVANHYYKWLEPSIKLESPEDDEEELEFLVGYKPGEDLERNPILAPIRTPYI
jgi:hypothetical protein